MLLVFATVSTQYQQVSYLTMYLRTPFSPVSPSCGTPIHNNQSTPYLLYCTYCLLHPAVSFLPPYPIRSSPHRSLSHQSTLLYLQYSTPPPPLAPSLPFERTKSTSWLLPCSPPVFSSPPPFLPGLLLFSACLKSLPTPHPLSLFLLFPAHLLSFATST